MAKKKKPLSAKKLLENLEPAGMVFTGMVRPSANDPNALMFARPGDKKWVKLDQDQIADIKLVQAADRGKRSHPIVNLVMKPPQSAEGRAYSGLAQLRSLEINGAGETDLCWDAAKHIWVKC